MSLWCVWGQPTLSRSRRLVQKPTFLSLVFCRSGERYALHTNIDSSLLVHREDCPAEGAGDGWSRGGMGSLGVLWDPAQGPAGKRVPSVYLLQLLVLSH